MARKKTTLQETKVSITLTGLTDIMFDRYAGDNKTTLRVDQKLYLASDNRIVLPSRNIMSLLCALNTESAAKRFLDARKYKVVGRAILSYVLITPTEIPFTRNGKPIVFQGLDADGMDKQAQVYTHRIVARLKDGVPNPKERPVLSMPWELNFTLSLFRNDEVKEETIQNLLIKGCLAIGLGTFRGRYGKCQVTQWTAH